MKDKKILLGVSGGIAVYKACSLASFLAKENEVKVVMTKSASEFVTPLTFQTLTKNKVITQMFDEDRADVVAHIYYPQEWCDLFIIAPATANIIGKAANGIADDMLSSCIVAATKPILFVPSMNTHMYENKIVQENIKKLKEYGYKFAEPASGMLACGTEGKGRFPGTKEIVEAAERMVV